MNGTTATRSGPAISFVRAAPDTADDAIDRLLTAAATLGHHPAAERPSTSGEDLLCEDLV